MQRPHEGAPVSSGDAFQHIQLGALHIDLEQVHAMQALCSLGAHRNHQSNADAVIDGLQLTHHQAQTACCAWECMLQLSTEQADVISSTVMRAAQQPSREQRRGNAD